MEADGQQEEADAQPQMTAEPEEQSTSHEQPPAIAHEPPSFEPPATSSDEMIGGIKPEGANAQPEADGPSASAGARKRKSIAAKAEESEGTPTVRRGRSSDAADSPAGSKKAKMSAKSPQVHIRPYPSDGLNLCFVRYMSLRKITRNLSQWIFLCSPG